MNTGLRILAAGSYLPETTLTNHDIAAQLNPTVRPEWVVESLGITQRRIANPEESTSDLATRAVHAALRNAGVSAQSIDLIVLATASPDMRAPATACIVQSKAGLDHAIAFDVSTVCSGFLFAMTVTASMIEAGMARRAVVVGADTFSDATSWERRDCVFFGDGAGAVIVERADRTSASGRDLRGNTGLFDAQLFSDGRDSDAFSIARDDGATFAMDGKGVFRAASQAVPDCIEAVLARNGIAASDIDIVIPHQPSRSLLEHIAKSCGIPFSRFELCMDRYANTVGATIPITLTQAMEAGRIGSGDLVLFAAAGAGFTAGAAVHRWS